MNGSNTTGSLPFLDLLTCGFGGVLMLVLILLAMGPELGIGDPGQLGQSAVTSSSSLDTKQPFLILVEFNHSGLNEEITWQVPEGGKWQPRHREVGSNFASLVAQQPPSRQASIVLTNVPASSEFSVQYFYNGKVLRKESFALSEKTNIEVWPNKDLRRP